LKWVRLDTVLNAAQAGRFPLCPDRRDALSYVKGIPKAKKTGRKDKTVRENPQQIATGVRGKNANQSKSAKARLERFPSPQGASFWPLAWFRLTHPDWSGLFRRSLAKGSELDLPSNSAPVMSATAKVVVCLRLL
jgi:hypothetical protein